MPAIAITSGLYAGTGQLISELADRCRCEIFTDRRLTEKACQIYNISPALFHKVFRQKPIAFNRFTHDREKALAALKATLADSLVKDNCIFTGMASHLVPDQISHLLRILVTAPFSRRVNRGMILDDRPEKSAAASIEKSDHHLSLWVSEFRDKSPWDPALYHQVLEAEQMDLPTALDGIDRLLQQDPFRSGPPCRAEVEDFRLACQVEVALTGICQGLVVAARNGDVTVTLDKKVLHLSKVQQQLLRTAEGVAGVKEVKLKIGPNYYRSRNLKI